MPALLASGTIIEVTPGRVRPENGEVSSTLRTGASHDPRVRQPSSPAPDRRHDDPPFRRLFLDGLSRAHATGRLGFFGTQARLAQPEAFNALLAALRRIEWVVSCKRPFGGPAVVLAYLARYTHRVAISNSRLIACDADGVSFHWKDYRVDGRARSKVMRLSVDEFIRRFLLHVLPDGFHRIRHDGLFGNGVRQANLARARTLLAVADKPMAMNASRIAQSGASFKEYDA